ncbi:MAG: NAD-dependent epimerase/dehydratase family protein [Anaerolineae bacterium]|nr:NAD-dependent epimerase/dehydratase family protein [Anaerolineae bacterium]
MRESVLVTGGAGFIGSHVSRHLLEMGYHVVVLDDLSGGFTENVPPGAELVVDSVMNAERIDALFAQHRFSYVFHLAAYAAEGLSHFIKRFNYNNNLIGSVNLINAAVNYQVKCFVFTSSIAVYGKGQLPMTEDLVPEPEDSYGIAKYAVEMELRVSHEMFGLNYIIFRPHNVYGENQNIGDTYRNVIGIFMNRIMQGQPMTVFGDGEQTRAFTYIADVAPIIARSVIVPEAYNQVFNVGADQAHSVNHLAEVVAGCMGVEANIQHLDPRNEVQHAFSDHEKVRRIFQLGESVPLEQGVARMAEWARRVGARESSIFGEIEIEKNLPASWRLKMGK